MREALSWRVRLHRGFAAVSHGRSRWMNDKHKHPGVSRCVALCVAGASAFNARRRRLIKHVYLAPAARSVMARRVSRRAIVSSFFIHNMYNEPFETWEYEHLYVGLVLHFHNFTLDAGWKLEVWSDRFCGAYVFVYRLHAKLMVCGAFCH